MNQLPESSTETTDLEPVSVEERARRRFVAALKQSRHGGPAPDVEQCLESVPESARTSLREELEALKKGGGQKEDTTPDDRHHETKPGTAPGHPQTVDYVGPPLTGGAQREQTQPIGTVAYVSRDNADFSITPSAAATTN